MPAIAHSPFSVVTGSYPNECSLGVQPDLPRRIWLNLELAKKPQSCIEYVLVHEMVHLIEHRHNDRFEHLMSQVMPSWPLHRDELNGAPLAHENWTY